MKILVKTKLFSHENKIEKHNNELIAFIKKPPEKGKANKAIIKLLARYFKTAINNIKLIKGHKQKNKIFEIKND